MKNALTIGTLSNHCRFIGKAEDSAVVASEIRQLAESRLPDAIDAEINRRLQTFLGQEGIYRIRRLRVNFTMTRRDLSASRLSALLASQLVNALENQLSSSSGDIVHFKSEAEFIASLMAALLLGNQKDAWMYEDYAALRHLRPVDAAVQLLLPRLHELPTLIAGLQRRDALATLLHLLDEHHAKGLLQAWSGIGLHQQFQIDSVSAPGPLTQCQDWLASLSLIGSSASVPLAEATVRMLLSGLAISKPPADPSVALRAVMHRVFLSRYRREILALTSTGTPSREEESALALFDASAIPPAKELLTWMEVAPDRRRYIESLLHRSAEPTAPSNNANAHPENSRHDVAPVETLLFSKAAGLVLLIPVLISLRLHTCFSMATLRRALRQTLTDEPVTDAASASDNEETWLQMLLPDNLPQQVADAQLPAGWRIGLSAQRQAQIEALTGHEQLSHLLLAGFAARLSGMQLSSHQYLRQQFLQCQGHFVVDEQRIVARLESIPLAIVLQMAGLATWSERIPWLKRKLTIEIKT